jgi:DNA replication licensing factor MCM5
MARHIVDVHKGVHNMDMEEVDIEIPLLKKYIAYARSKVSPRLTEESANMLTNLYVKDR